MFRGDARGEEDGDGCLEIFAGDSGDRAVWERGGAGGVRRVRPIATAETVAETAGRECRGRWNAWIEREYGRSDGERGWLFFRGPFRTGALAARTLVGRAGGRAAAGFAEHRGGAGRQSGSPRQPVLGRKTRYVVSRRASGYAARG